MGLLIDEVKKRLDKLWEEFCDGGMEHRLSRTDVQRDLLRSYSNLAIAEQIEGLKKEMGCIAAEMNKIGNILSKNWNIRI